MSDYLIKFGNTWLPDELLLSDGWNPTPNQRTELDAYRDAAVNLHRTTSPNYKTTIILNFCPMSKTDKERLQGIINSAMINTVERKIQITYWNDETNEYTDGVFYIPDITFQSLGYFGGERWYKSFSIKLTEY